MNDTFIGKAQALAACDRIGDQLLDWLETSELTEAQRAEIAVTLGEVMLAKSFLAKSD